MADYDKLLRHIRGRLGDLRRADFVQGLADNLQDELIEEMNFNESTGALEYAVSKMGPLKSEPGMITIGVGDMSLLGSPDQATPGTLTEFFDYYDLEPKKYWRALTPKNKELLKQGRRRGLFGGPMYHIGDPARYYYVQSGDKPAWRASAAKAKVDPTFFTGNALNNWRLVTQAKLDRKFGSRTDGE